MQYNFYFNLRVIKFVNGKLYSRTQGAVRLIGKTILNCKCNLHFVLFPIRFVQNNNSPRIILLKNGLYGEKYYL